VQELVGWVAGAAFKTRKNKFHGAGREDIDVRMLGDGRPFVLEMVNPKCLDVDLAALEPRSTAERGPSRGARAALDREGARARHQGDPHAKEYEARVEIEGEPAPRRSKRSWTALRVTLQTRRTRTARTAARLRRSAVRGG
jgi:tRNA pseudouridine synthase 10